MPPDATRLRFEQVCAECKSSDFVEDHSQGDLVCTNCGLVAESRCIDERSEWRTFGDKDGGVGADPNRVGGPSNHLLSNDLSTDIGQGRGTATLAQSLKRTAFQSGGDPDKTLSQAFRRIRLLCDSMGLLKVVYDTACEIYKKVSEAGVVKGRSLASVIPAVIYMACRKELNPRTFKEILLVATDTTHKDVAKSFTAITKKMDVADTMPTAHVKDFMRRFCNQLGLKHLEITAAEDFALAACPRDGKHIGGGTRPWDSKTPMSVASAIILIISRMPRSSALPTVSDIAIATGVADTTVRSTAAGMYPYASSFVPQSYASKETVARVIQTMQLHHL